MAWVFIFFTLAVFMLETLKLSKMLKLSQDNFNDLDNFNISSINASIKSLRGTVIESNTFLHAISNPAIEDHQNLIKKSFNSETDKVH